MMKQEIRNRYTGEIQFIADIVCEENVPFCIRIGLAVDAAISEGVSLKEADLSGANLSGANLRNVDLKWADLKEADLSDADLSKADLSNADLRGADLRWADLKESDLSGTGLRYYKSDLYECYIQTEYMQINCESHSWDDWESFDDKRILEMDGKSVLKWWRVNKPILQAIRDSIEVQNYTE